MKKRTASLLLLMLVNGIVMAQNDYYLVTGSYTTSADIDGIHVFDFDENNTTLHLKSSAKAPNASFLTLSADGKHIYATAEMAGQEAKVSAFSLDKSSGKVAFINQQPSHGNAPCYIDIDKTGKWVVVGNYSSGNLAIYPLATDGSLQAAKQTPEHFGSGINKQRQEKPHVHATVFSKDNNWLFVPDLGIDKVVVYQFHPTDGKLIAAENLQVNIHAGGGPRHLAFHPDNNYAYVIEEMSGFVSAFKYNNGHFTFVQRIRSVEEDDKGFIGSADIHVSPDGKHLYASNRGGKNTIAIYSINPNNGELTAIGHQSSLGEIPRNFTIHPSGLYVLVGNQESNEIVIFRRDAATGILTDTGKRVKVPKPVCLKWVKK